jgi:hypothetical protein
VGTVIFDVVAFFSDHPVFRLLKFIKLIDSAQAALEAHNNTFTFDTNYEGLTGEVTNSAYATEVLFRNKAGREVSFSPSKFMQANNLTVGDELALKELDDKISNDYGECNEAVIYSGEGNHIENLRMRLNCLQNKGYDSNKLSYVEIKHGYKLQHKDGK